MLWDSSEDFTRTMDVGFPDTTRLQFPAINTLFKKMVDPAGKCNRVVRSFLLEPRARTHV